MIASIFSGTNSMVAQWVSSGPYCGGVNALAVSGNNIFAGASVGAFLSTNNGTTWKALGSALNTTAVRAFALSGNNVFAGTDLGVFLSTNNGMSWTAAGSDMDTLSVTALAVSGNTVFAGTGSGIFVTSNNGAHWTAANTGLEIDAVLSLAVIETYLYAGTNGRGVWRRPLSELVTSVGMPSTDFPMDFSLDQNYPNPFNPSTMISYAIPTRSHVTLTVFNILGQKVAELVNAEKEPGVYNVTFGANALASGVYLYRMQAGSFVQTKKLVVVK